MNIETLLKQHDWFYLYSDDIRVYRKGELERNAIKTYLSQLKPKEAKALLLDYMPENTMHNERDYLCT